MHSSRRERRVRAIPISRHEYANVERSFVDGRLLDHEIRNERERHENLSCLSRPFVSFVIQIAYEVR